MADDIRTDYAFASRALDEGLLQVVRFDGFEAISQPFQFEIDLASTDPEIDLSAVLSDRANLSLERSGEEPLRFHGVLADFEQHHQGPEFAYYRAVLVPRFWLMSLRVQNQVHQQKTVVDILRTELEDAGFVEGDDFEFRLRGSYPEREYVVQYGESDLAFLSRWMEHEGIFFFFEHGEEAEKMVIADTNDAFVSVPGDPVLPYRPFSGRASSGSESVQSLQCRRRRLPRELILKDYNYRTPSVDLRCDTTVDEAGEGLVSSYGDHYKDPDEGSRLARVRAEEMRCRQTLFHVDSDSIRMRSGYRFELEEHYRAGFNQEYLVTEVRHRGAQTRFGESGLSEEGDEALGYRNEVEAIPSEVAFRPARVTPRPRLHGIMNARVDASGPGDYAEVDDQGRYKVVMPFDLSGRGEGRASRFVRMAQPYAGSNYGMHFPLHKGVEVLWSCVDGDPDRPVICGSVPNPETQSPVTSSNQTHNLIRTASGNEIEMGDVGGEERILMSSPNSGTWFKLGAANNPPAGIAGRTAGEVNLHGEGNWSFSTSSSRVDRISDDFKTVVGNKSEINVGGGGQHLHVEGPNKVQVDDISDWLKVGASKEVSLSLKTTENMAATNTQTIGAEHASFFGIKVGECAAANLAANAGLKAEKNAVKDLTESLIKETTAQTLHKMKAVGHEMESDWIELQGTSAVDIKVGGSLVKVEGGKVTIKSSSIWLEASDVYVKGNLTVTKDLVVNGKINDK